MLVGPGFSRSKDLSVDFKLIPCTIGRVLKHIGRHNPKSSLSSELDLSLLFSSLIRLFFIAMKQEGHLFPSITFLVISTLPNVLSFPKRNTTSTKERPELLTSAEKILLKEERFLERVFSVISGKGSSHGGRIGEDDWNWLQLKTFLGTFDEAPSLQSQRGFQGIQFLHFIQS